MRALTCLASVFFLLLPAASGAANHYVRAGATGTGTDWANAMPALPPVLVRGDTYYVADGTYAEYIFNTPAAGGAVITVKKAIPIDHGTDAGWSASYGDGKAVFNKLIFETSYITVDGQSGGGPANWQGGFGFEVYHPAAASGSTFGLVMVKKGAVSNINLKHIDMHFNTSEAGADAVDNIIYGPAACSGCTVSYSYLHDVPGVPILIRGWSSFLVEYSYIARNRSNPKNHAEGVSTWGGGNFTFRYNVWEDIEGTAIIVNLTNSTHDWEIYGNLFFKSGNPAYGNPSHGIVSDNFSSSSYNSDVIGLKFYNNTIVGFSGNSAGLRFWSSGSRNIVANNNLWYNCLNVGFVRVNHDYNYYGSSTFTYEFAHEPHEEVSSSSPFVNQAAHNYQLARPTVPGLVLGAPYNRDMYGKARGSDGVWDKGAYESGAGSSPGKSPSPPGGLTVQ